MRKNSIVLPRLTPRAPLSQDRRVGGVHRSKKRQLARKLKHRKQGPVGEE